MQFIGLQRIGHELVTEQQKSYIYMVITMTICVYYLALSKIKVSSHIFMKGGIFATRSEVLIEDKLLLSHKNWGSGVSSSLIGYVWKRQLPGFWEKHFWQDLHTFQRDGFLKCSVQFSSVQSLSCVQLCGPMNRSTPGLPVHHQLSEFTQTHVH